MLIRGARVWPAGAHLATEAALADLPRDRRAPGGGLIAECAPGLRPEPGEEVIDAAGGVLLPGLHDHHVHLRALAAAAASVSVGPPRRSRPPASWPRGCARRTRTCRRARGCAPSVTTSRSPGRWTATFSTGSSPSARCGYSTAPERSGWSTRSPPPGSASTSASSSGVERDDAGRPTGRLWRMDRWLADRVPGLRPRTWRAVSRTAAALGITGFTDATPGATAVTSAFLAEAPIAQRLYCMAPAGGTPAAEAITAGR